MSTLGSGTRVGIRALSVRRSTTSSTRFASTLDSPPVVVRVPPANSGFRSALTASTLVLGTGLFVVYYYDSRSAIHRWVIPPLMRATLDPEVSHRLAVRVLGTPFAPKDQSVDDEVLKCTIWDIQMPSPIGLAAGFDKDGEAIDGLFGLGFDWVEIGSVTPKPQRPKLQSALANETGGLSGPPLHPLSIKALKILRSHLPANIPIIGCGGITTGADALAFARAGATSVQLYTSFGYNGVGTARRIKDELTEELRRQGTTWQQVVTNAIREHAWVKPEGEKGLEEGERELRAMLDGLGKQLSVGDGEDEDSNRHTKRLEELKLDSDTKKLAKLAEEAIASGPHAHDARLGQPEPRLAHAPRPTALAEQPATHGSLTNTAKDGTSALEKRRLGA
ncbi:Dihydroorotate dehydrogenase (quinone), mitochondrial [Ceratobasidium sp. 394]|nr:Dihydroorotate dehydrogenase (quinone), mitochondrial [Ceratobasidium sp. 394]